MKRTIFIWAILIGVMVFAPVLAVEISPVPGWANYTDYKSACFDCHIDLSETKLTKREEVIEPAVRWQKDNIHKDKGMDCEVCHKLIYGEYDGMRMGLNFDCSECHEEQFPDETNLHYRVTSMMKTLGVKGVVCSDCHNPHSTQKLVKATVPVLREPGRGATAMIAVLIVVLIGVEALQYKKQKEQGGK